MGNKDNATRIADAAAESNWLAVIKFSQDQRDTRLWEAAMTAHFGPCGIDPSRTDAKGCPTPATRAAFPRIDRAMTDAAAKCLTLIFNA